MKLKKSCKAQLATQLSFNVGSKKAIKLETVLMQGLNKVLSPSTSPKHRASRNKSLRLQTYLERKKKISRI